MFFLLKPDPEEIQRYLRSALLRKDQPTYDLGLEHDIIPDGFDADHNRTLLGIDCFETARGQLRQWRPFDIGWVELCWPDAPLTVGTTVAPLISVFGLLWSLSPARIATVIDEERCFGFSYVTLPDHEECGEERFLVEWLPNGEVWYDVYAISRPRHWLARLAYPLSRLLQKRFANNSMRAMREATYKRPR